MNIEELILQIKKDPASIDFQKVMETIDQHYTYTPVRFTNGDLVNEAGTNEGSCKIFTFGKLHGLSKEETLACFGEYYRNDVLGNPSGSDHANIRNFMQHGWSGIEFDTLALTLK